MVAEYNRTQLLRLFTEAKFRLVLEELAATCNFPPQPSKCDCCCIGFLGTPIN